jgi:tRNA pseudouridine55 synthase
MAKFNRIVDGILLLDKPEGITSNAALQRVKRIYSAKKAGHTGSLDPLASGMLPICLGEATKFSQFLLDADKVYQVTIKLGISTTTGDAEGDVVKERAVPKLSVADVNKVLEGFIGDVVQVPSMYSAIKHNGQPLYKLARQGIEVERAPRTIKIFSIELLDFKENLLMLKIHCSKGTYVRTLAEDVGEKLNCGGHVAVLRRLQVDQYFAEQMVPLAKLESLIENRDFLELDQLLLPIESMVTHWPKVKISEAALYYLNHGQSVIIPHAPTHGRVCLVRNDGKFIGIGEIMDDGKVAPKRLMQTK